MGNVDVDAAVLYSGTCGENASWTLDSDGNLVFSGTGDIIFSDMDIPIKDYFEIVDNISNIIIEKGLTGVEGIGFISNCEKLKSISISDTVTKIGFAAFSGATRLTNIEIPKSVTTIGSSAFSGCIGLTKIEISNSITEIGANSFAECTGLTKIEIPKSVTTIESGAFSGCTRLTSITLRNVFSIGDNLFEGCDNLLTIRLLRAINDLPEKTFFDCTQLKELWIKGGFKEIKTNTFRYCSALTDVFYGGSEEEWKTINIKGYNDFLLNANINYYLCSEGSLEHTWDQGTITVAATCTTDGMKTYVCKKCGEIKEEIIAATGHTEVIDKDIAATCTTDGIKTYICKNCGEKTDEIIIPAAGHKLVLAKNVAVTCTENGIKKYECKNCKDKIDTVIIPATGHKTVADIGIAATCTTPGKTAGSHCSVCSRVLVSQNTIPAKGHMYRDIKIQATTKQNGSITKKCSTCGIESDRKTIYYPKTISLSKNSYSYDGKAKKPTVIVRGSNGKIIAKSNYRIFYKNNTKAGIATISIQYQGDYKGNITKTFKIMPKGTKLKTLSAVSKGFTVKWIKQSSQTTGYEIQYSTDSRFKNSAAKVKTVEKNTVTSQTIKKLAAKKKYYVRIRTYKQVSVNGKKQKLYSAWSTVRTIKTL